MTGAGGCGLCAIPSLQRAGVEWLKVVGRGAFTDQMISDIRAVRTAISLSQSSADDRSYRTLLMRTLFRDGCSRRCYYPEETP